MAKIAPSNIWVEGTQEQMDLLMFFYDYFTVFHRIILKNARKADIIEKLKMYNLSTDIILKYY